MVVWSSSSPDFLKLFQNVPLAAIPLIFRIFAFAHLLNHTSL